MKKHPVELRMLIRILLFSLLYLPIDFIIRNFNVAIGDFDVSLFSSWQEAVIVGTIAALSAEIFYNGFKTEK